MAQGTSLNTFLSVGVNIEKGGSSSKSKKGELSLVRPLETSGREYWRATANAGFLARERKQLGDLIGKNSFAGHARLEAWIIEPAVSDRSNPMENFVLSIGKVAGEPILKKLADSIGKPHQNIARVPSTCRTGCSEDRGHFMVCQAGDYGCHHYTGRDARLG